MASVVQVQDRGRRADGREIWFAPWGLGFWPTAWQGWVASLVTLVAVAVGLLLAGEFGPRDDNFPYAVIAAIAPPNIWYWWFSRRHSAPLRDLDVVEIGLADLADVLGALARSTQPRAFAAFVFNSPDRPAVADALNLQFSIEDGRLGFDWVLLNRRNIKDRDRFMAFAAAAGRRPVEKVLNGVSHLRLEDGDLVGFCRSVITRMYGLDPAQRIDMVVSGFHWPAEGMREAQAR